MQHRRRDGDLTSERTHGKCWAVRSSPSMSFGVSLFPACNMETHHFGRRHAKPVDEQDVRMRPKDVRIWGHHPHYSHNCAVPCRMNRGPSGFVTLCSFNSSFAILVPVCALVRLSVSNLVSILLDFGGIWGCIEKSLVMGNRSRGKESTLALLHSNASSLLVAGGRRLLPLFLLFSP